MILASNAIQDIQVGENFLVFVLRERRGVAAAA